VHSQPSSPADNAIRTDGFSPLRDYAAIGDGRTVALVARDGSIDWLCLPDVDSPSVFGRLLDASRGGCFALSPAIPFESQRQYLGETNVLVTTFHTSSGSARVTDAMTLHDPRALSPFRELVRKVEGVAGRVEFAWQFEPRFGYASAKTRVVERHGRVVATAGKDAVALAGFGAGDAVLTDAVASGRFAVEEGDSVVLSLSAAYRDPLVLTGRDDAERRLDAATRFWEGWASKVDYEGPWRDAVVRSALALKLLVFAPSGAIVAAPTTSLPEWIGAGRNWDYRYAWVRDAAFTLTALLRLGFVDEARAFFWWLGHATALTQPRLNVLYRVGGGIETEERELELLSGYANSRPVRVGNGALKQVQLDVYGYAVDSIWQYASRQQELPGVSGRAVARIADWVAENWRQPDSGIWEVRSEPRQYIQSKAMCWVALDRACRLAARGLIPDRGARWRAEGSAIRAFVDERGWDDEEQTYVRAPDLRETDGSLLTLALLGYEDPRGSRMIGTIDAIRRDLAEGALVDRYRDDGHDGVGGRQGVFVTCSFWFVAALARAGRTDEAVGLMDELVGLSNDVGLYAEEIDRDGTFLGNFPQALVHLALIDAALAVADAERGR
jgi:GH15 family glucan-1,4-alpha-glucosidase